MDDLVCKHEDIESNVTMIKLFENEDAIEEGNPNRFVAEVQIRFRCAECKAPFGFRAPDTGLLPDRPAISPDAIELRIPLISPSELELRESVRITEGEDDGN